MHTKTPPKDLQATWHNFVADNFQNLGIESIIDIGSGWGKSRERLQKITPNVKTQDVNRALMTTVDYVLQPRHLTKRYDLVTTFDVFEHIPDFEVDSWLLDLIRLTRKYLFITTPNGWVHTQPWHYKPMDFLKLVCAVLNHHIIDKSITIEHFLRYKMADSDIAKKVPQHDFLTSKTAYALGLCIKRKE